MFLVQRRNSGETQCIILHYTGLCRLVWDHNANFFLRSSFISYKFHFVMFWQKKKNGTELDWHNKTKKTQKNCTFGLTQLSVVFARTYSFRWCCLHQTSPPPASLHTHSLLHPTLWHVTWEVKFRSNPVAFAEFFFPHADWLCLPGGLECAGIKQRPPSAMTLGEALSLSFCLKNQNKLCLHSNSSHTSTRPGIDLTWYFTCWMSWIRLPMMRKSSWGAEVWVKWLTPHLTFNLVRASGGKFHATKFSFYCGGNSW